MPPLHRLITSQSNVLCSVCDNDWEGLAPCMEPLPHSSPQLSPMIQIRIHVFNVQWPTNVLNEEVTTATPMPWWCISATVPSCTVRQCSCATVSMMAMHLMWMWHHMSLPWWCLATLSLKGIDIFYIWWFSLSQTHSITKCVASVSLLPSQCMCRDQRKSIYALICIFWDLI